MPKEKIEMHYWKTRPDQYMSDCADRLKGRAHCLSYNDGPMKSDMREAEHCLNTRNTYVDGATVRNALGASRQMTAAERLAWWIFGAVPTDAVANRKRRRAANIPPNR